MNPRSPVLARATTQTLIVLMIQCLAANNLRHEDAPTHRDLSSLSSKTQKQYTSLSAPRFRSTLGGRGARRFTVSREMRHDAKQSVDDRELGAMVQCNTHPDFFYLDRKPVCQCGDGVFCSNKDSSRSHTALDQGLIPDTRMQCMFSSTTVQFVPAGKIRKDFRNSITES